MKTCVDIAPSLRSIARPRRSVLRKDRRSWRKPMNMSVSRSQSSKPTSPVHNAHRGTWLPLRERGRRYSRKTLRGFATCDAQTETGKFLAWFKGSLPPPRRRGPPPRHILGHTGLADLNCKFGEGASILALHNGLAMLMSRISRLRETVEQTPANISSVNRDEGRSSGTAPAQHIDLLPQDQNFCLKRATRDRSRSITIPKISLHRSNIRQPHRPILRSTATRIGFETGTAEFTLIY